MCFLPMASNLQERADEAKPIISLVGPHMMSPVIRLQQTGSAVLHEATLETAVWLVKCYDVARETTHFVAHVICRACAGCSEHASLHPECRSFDVALAICVVVARRLAPGHDVSLTETLKTHATLVHLHATELFHPAAALALQVVVSALLLRRLRRDGRAVTCVVGLPMLSWYNFPLIVAVRALPMED